MTKVYIIDTKGVPALPMSLVFWPNYRFDIPEKRLFLKEIMTHYAMPFVEIVSTMEAADFVAVPFDYFFVAHLRGDYHLTELWAVLTLQVWAKTFNVRG